MCHPTTAAHPECSILSGLQPTQVLHSTPLLCSLHCLLVAARIWFKTRYLCTVLQMALTHPTSRKWLNHATQPIHLALLLPNGLLLPCYVEVIAIIQQNHDCLLSWLHNGGTSSPLTSGQQKLFTPSMADWTLICSDSTLAHEEKRKTMAPISLSFLCST